MEVDDLDTPQSAPENNDGEIEDSSASSSFDSESDMNEDEGPTRIVLGGSGAGTPVLDERTKDKQSKGHSDEGPASPPPEDFTVCKSPTTPGAHHLENIESSDDAEEEISRTDNVKQVQHDSVYSKPSALKQHLEKQSNTKSVARMSMDDHGELDFDESEDEGEDPRRDWKNETHVAASKQRSKSSEKEEGEESTDDEIIDENGVTKQTSLHEGKQEDDCEEGEIMSEDEDTSSPDEDALDEIENPQAHLVYEMDDRPMCRFYNRGNCHFGMNCRFLHPGMNDMPPITIRGPPPAWGSGADPGPIPPRDPTPPPSPKKASPPTESAWERGLRHAKKMRELAKKRKEREVNFEDKRMNLSVEVLDDEKVVTEKKKPESVVEVPKAKEKSSKENKENENTKVDVPPQQTPPYEDKMVPKNDPYYDDPKMHRDPYYDQGYEDEYYEPDGDWNRGHYDGYQVRPWNREPDYQPPQHYRKEYPPAKDNYNREQEYNEPYHKDHRDLSPEREREYWDRRREEDYKKFKKYKALRDNREDEPPINRVRGEEWSDPWARVREPQRRRRSGSRSRSRGRRRKRSLSGSSSSYTSSSYSSRSRSRSSYSSSSYSSRSSYSRSSSFSSRSRSRSAGKDKKRPLNTLGAAVKKAAIPKSTEGPPKSTVTKVGSGTEDRRRPGGPPTGPPPTGRDRLGPSNKGPPKGPPPGGRPSGPPKPAGQGKPPLSVKASTQKPLQPRVSSNQIPPGQKGGPPHKGPPPTQREASVQKPVLTTGALAAEKVRKERIPGRNLPGRMRRRSSHSYSSSSSSRSRSRSRSRRSSHSSSSSTGSSSTSSHSSGSDTDQSHDGHNKRKDLQLSRKNPEDARQRLEDDSSKGRRNDIAKRKIDTDSRSQRPLQDTINRRDKEPFRDKQRQQQSQIPKQLQDRPFDTRRNDKPEKDRMMDRSEPTDRGDKASDKQSKYSQSSKLASAPDSKDTSAPTQKSGIKLTLINKTDKMIQRPTKRTISNGSTEEPDNKKGKQVLEESQEKLKKVKESPSAGSTKESKKKSTSSRREELLKQLKAVESAIIRKRSKIS